MLIGFVVSVKVMLDIMDPAGGRKKPDFEVTEEDVEVGRGFCSGVYISFCCMLRAGVLTGDLPWTSARTITLVDGLGGLQAFCSVLLLIVARHSHVRWCSRLNPMLAYLRNSTCFHAPVPKPV